MKKKNILPIITILCISLVLIGTSYAYWKFTYISDKTNTGQSKCLSIELTNQKNEISLTNTYPITDEEAKKLTPYSFTITNTCDTFISYDVNLEMLEGTTMNSKYMAVMINNEKKELLSNLDSTSTVMNGSVESRKLVSGSLSSEDSVDYTLRLWMDESVTMSDDAMNKNFTSKIVVTAQPSNYSPKEAGYDTLHDAILANEYQTTPEKAIEKIEAKGEPDLSQTAPIINWVEKIGKSKSIIVSKPTIDVLGKDELTDALTENDTKIRLYTSYSFDAETGKYILANPIYVDPTTINYTAASHYYFQSEYIYYNQSNNKLATAYGNQDILVYEITGAEKKKSETVWHGTSYESIDYDLKATELTSSELETDKSDKGLYKSIDDYGNTYYYRGNVKNNNVYFAGYYWQIVRINGNNSIRLIYNGNIKGANGINQSINSTTYQFNSKYDKPVYVGYMYGDSDATSYDDVHSNVNDSTAKTIIDDWYKTNIIDAGYSAKISEMIGFCGDKALYSGDGIKNNVKSYFGTYERYINHKASFLCSNVKRDLYTTSDSDIGNNSLIYPVGLISYDELVYGGLDGYHINKLSYLYSSSNYWTMTPSNFLDSNQTARIWINNASGSLYGGWNVSDLLVLRPVINLKSDVKISGGIGTVNDPFVIDTNN